VWEIGEGGTEFTYAIKLVPLENLGFQKPKLSKCQIPLNACSLLFLSVSNFSRHNLAEAFSKFYSFHMIFDSYNLIHSRFRRLLPSQLGYCLYPPSPSSKLNKEKVSQRRSMLFVCVEILHSLNVEAIGFWYHRNSKRELRCTNVRLVPSEMLEDIRIR
jgi:hypothetical protein